MTNLLPEAVRTAVTALETDPASESFGIVTLVVLVVLLIERDALAVARRGRVGPKSLSAFALPLLVAATVTILMRVLLLAG